MNSGSSPADSSGFQLSFCDFFSNCLLHPQHHLGDISIGQQCIVWKGFTFSFCVACEFHVLQQCLFGQLFVILSNLVNTLIFHGVASVPCEIPGLFRYCICENSDRSRCSLIYFLDFFFFLLIILYLFWVGAGKRSDDVQLTACYLRCSARSLILRKWTRE